MPGGSLDLFIMASGVAPESKRVLSGNTPQFLAAKMEFLDSKVKEDLCLIALIRMHYLS
jgi:hypothetical protein